MSGRGKFFSFWLFLSAQRAKMWANRHIFSHFSLISQAREVELRHFKSLKPSTWYGQCREAMGKCSSLFSTAQWANMWANCQILSHFSLISQARKVGLRHFKSLKSSINQVYTSALWAIRCTPVHYEQSGVHYGQAGVHQCTMGNQVCTISKQVYTSAP